MRAKSCGCSSRLRKRSLDSFLNPSCTARSPRLFASLRQTDASPPTDASVLIDSVLINDRSVQTQPIVLGIPKRIDKQQIAGVLANIIKKKKEIMKGGSVVPKLPHKMNFKVVPASHKKPEALQQRPKEDGNNSTVLPLIPRRQVSCKEFDERDTLPKSQLKYIGLSKDKISANSKNGSNGAQLSVDSPLLPRKNQSNRKPASFHISNQEDPIFLTQKKMPSSTDRNLIIRNSIDLKKELQKYPSPKKPSSFKPDPDSRTSHPKESSIDE